MRLTKSKNGKKSNLKEKNTQFLKEFKRGVKGITLLALVVTIIVMLILAGITLNLTIGNNGIFKRAEKAAVVSEIARIKEEAEMLKGSVYIDNANEQSVSREEIINAIEKGMNGTANGNLITTEDGKYEIMVKADNEIEVVLKGEGYVDAEYVEIASESDFEYKIENEEVTITKYKGDDTVVNIPTTIEGYPVTVLDGNSFYNCNLQSVNIPNTVKKIGKGAFLQNKLRYIDIPNSVIDIGVLSFNDNQIVEEQAYIYKRTDTGAEDKTTLISYGGKEKNITIPETVRVIDQYAFNGCSSIEDVVIGNKVEEIKLASFSNCINLTNVIIGDNVESIGMSAFGASSNLRNVVIGEKVRRIELWAFATYSDSLENVEFKGNVPDFSYEGSGDSIEGEEGSVGGTISVLSGGTFSYNENMRIKVPKGTLQDYITAKVTLNGEEYYNTLETWFYSIIEEPQESWLNVFYE